MMKNIYRTIMFILLCTMFLSSKNVTANSNFIIMSDRQDEYTLDVTIRNFKYELYDIAYVGQKLSNLDPTCTVRLNGEIVYGRSKWENEDYVLVNGSQDVNIIFNPNYGEKIVFTITITPMTLEVKTEPKHMYFVDHSDYIFKRYIGSSLEDIVPIYSFWSIDVKNIDGTMEYFNYEDLSLGDHEIGWRFTPFDTDYAPMDGIYKVQIIPKPIEQTNEIDEPTVLSLTATSILLETKSAYDINLSNKISGSKYKWMSSNPDIVEANSKNGLVTAISEGNAIVTCEITLPDNSIQILESLVIVGYDENAPILTETILDLEVGDKFDINLENKIAKSKYRWASSNRDIVKVNSSNGKVTAVGIGEVYVTCTITTPENQVIVLRCDINITELNIVAE